MGNFTLAGNTVVFQWNWSLDYQGQPPLTNGGLCHKVRVSTKGFILVLLRLSFKWCNHHSNHHPLFASNCFPETFQPCIAFHPCIGPLTSMKFPQRSTSGENRLHGKGANLEIYLVHSQGQRHTKGGPPISSLWVPGIATSSPQPITHRTKRYHIHKRKIAGLNRPRGEKKTH